MNSPESRLRCFMNIESYDSMRPKPEGDMHAIRAAGYEGAQFPRQVNPARKAEALRLSLVLVRIAGECFVEAQKLHENR